MKESSHSFENSFTLVRHLAAIQVLLVHTFHHFGYQSILVDALELFPGVPIFFCISGYLIGRSYLNLRDPVLKQFAWRRALRIFPALWCVVACGALLPIVVGYLDVSDLLKPGYWLWIAGQATIVQFYNPDFMRGFGVGVMNGALWTISVELTFYMLTPVLIFMMRRSTLAVVPLVVLSISANLYLHTGNQVETFYEKILRASFLPWISTFIFGCYFAYSKYARNWLSSLPLWLIAGGFVTSMFLIGDASANSSNAINPISTLLLVFLTIRFGESRSVYKTLGRFSVWRHDFSYGIYIWHMPIINTLLFMGTFTVWQNIAIALTLTVITAVTSWFVVEQPMLALKGKIKATGKAAGVASKSPAL